MERRCRAWRSSLAVVLVATCLHVAGDGRAGAESAITLNPDADATVSAAQPGSNFAGGTLQVNGKPRRDAYLRFGVPAGATGRAVLRLWVLDPTADGPKIRRYDGWLNESTITWANRVPGLAGAPVDSGRLEAGTWAEWDVSHLVRPGGLTLALVADSTDGVEFSSRESDRSPRLVITTAATAPTGSPPPSPSPSPSPSTASSTTSTVQGSRSSPACEPSWASAQPMAELGRGLGEMSAFIASPNHRRWAWGIRDSGQPASLYAIEPEAESVRTQEFRAYGLRNSDWEDLTYTPGPAPGTGHLWVLENVGNGWTGNRLIYQFEELDPENPPPPPPPPPPSPITTTSVSPPTTSTSTTSTTSTSPPRRRPRGTLRAPRGTLSAAAITTAESDGPSAPQGEPATTKALASPLPVEPRLPAATLLGAYEWAYPDTQVNTESMFVFHGDLVVVTKTEPSRVYRFESPLQTTALNVPAYVGTLPAGKRLSVAALSADQRTLAVSSHGKLNVYENRGDVGDLAALISNHVFHQDMPPDNREGGSFFPHGSCDLLLVAESKTIWRLEHR